MIKGFYDIKNSKMLFQNILGTFSEYQKHNNDYSLFLLILALNSNIEWLEKEENPKSDILDRLFEIRKEIINPLANRAKHRMNQVGDLDKGGFILGLSGIGGNDLIGENHRFNKQYLLSTTREIIKLLTDFYDLTPEEIAIVEENS